ncbi:MAG: cysteine desulfurase [Lachnospiraceae bacterium]|nr:cysteine desulfurase [Lachnospiraceae bacterium]
MEIYLDNSATTPVLPSVKEAMSQMFDMEYGNPSSMHLKGVAAEEKVLEAAKKIAATLGAKEKEILFTSGGTEGNNLAIIGAARAKMRAGKHIITTSIEHASVHNVMEHLEAYGWEVTYLPVDHQGRVAPEDVLDALRPDTVLVSVMMVNNEIGAREPVEEIGRALKDVAPQVLFHVDAIQGYGKYRIRPGRCGIDLMTVSGHKIHGPKGVGFLYIRDKVKIDPILFGGGQQNGLRSGTLNTPGIVGLGLAAEEICRDLEVHTEQMYRLKERLTEGLKALDGVTVNGPAPREGAPQIVSASFEGLRSEVLLHALEEEQIYVSAGSACGSAHPEDNRTLYAIGLRGEKLVSTLRFSLSIYTTEEEIDRTLEVLRAKLPLLRRFVRR